MHRSVLARIELVGASVLGILVGLACVAASSVAGQPPADEELTLLAETQEQVEEGHLRASGDVDVRAGSLRLQADTVEFWHEKMFIVADGNVVFQQGNQKIVGTRMEVDLNDGTGRFYNAHGVAGEDFYFYGDIVERESEDVYVIHGGAFTSCTQPVPRWRFTAGAARVRLHDYVLLHNAFLRVKSVPVFYLPMMYYPIDEEGRSTGFLMPQIGSSTFKGFTMSEAFFWAVNRSMDATFNVDRFSEAGLGTGVEYRYVLSEASRGQFTTYFLQDKVSDQGEYSLNYSLNQELPGGFRSVARVDYFSSFDFQQRFQESYNAATQRSKRATGTVSRNWSRYNFRLLFDRNDTSFQDRVAVRQILPQASFGSRPTRLGGTPLLLGFDGEAANFSRTVGDTDVAYQRFDLLPSISYPFTSLSYLTLRTTLSGRYTYYTARVDEGGDILDGAVDRRYYDVQLDARGPTFARIFNTPGNFYAERYKHVIEPQIVWNYRSRVDTFDVLPKFDSGDYVPGTNQFAFSLVNRFLAKRRVEGNENPPPVEFLTWVLSQRYFFDVNASLYDTQFSTPYFSPDGTPSRYSPITSKLRFQPFSGLRTTWNMDYDINFGKLTSVSLVGTYQGPSWGAVTGSWSRRALTRSDTVRNNMRGVANLNLGTRVQTSFEVNYDYSLRIMRQLRAGLTYNIQCCGFLVEFSRYNFGNFRDENIFRFGVTLANVGSFGTFLGGREGAQ